ncbi:hypothetical protein [Lacrimispora sp. 38-1]|uniref:hypothetical protein n=1 Tax=Lacrimispora sp. 38-1 TaxID=3125778 RepID=UPI003CF732DC
MKKFICISILFMSVLLCSCSASGKKISVPEELAVKNSEGKILELYMPREEAEKILGETEERSWTGGYDYGNIIVGYKENLLTYIQVKDDSWKLMNGIKVGDSIDSLTSYENPGSTDLRQLYYKKDGSNYSKVLKKDIPQKAEKSDYGVYCSSEIIGINGTIEAISACDRYVGASGDMED